LGIYEGTEGERLLYCGVTFQDYCDRGITVLQGKYNGSLEAINGYTSNAIAYLAMVLSRWAGFYYSA
jgi:hypothetical protein